MKKILIIYIILFTIPVKSQSVKDQKFVKKLDLVVINNGINFKDTFVVYNNYLCAVCGGVEKSWKNSLSKASMNTGYWYGAKNNITIDGRYKFLVDKNSILISDSKENFKIVASISHKNSGMVNFMNNKNHIKMRDYILKILIQSNPD
jgi:hypothetical protein|tara:strand:+ start:94 stop:537 length:444 start_codon:yes stop_codon:yes gene_type:complete